MVLHPGRVPKNWGFYMGDEAKRRRYCRMCNVWKPDRTHHCSTCAQCVLNMDHHCPWLNNCIGFWNRKFFIQLLCYAFLANVISVLLLTYAIPASFVPYLRDVGFLRPQESGFLHVPYAFDRSQPFLPGEQQPVNLPKASLVLSRILDFNQVEAALGTELASIDSPRRVLKVKEESEVDVTPLSHHYGYMGSSLMFGVLKFTDEFGDPSFGGILKCLMLVPVVHFWYVITFLVFIGVFAMIIPLGRFVYFHISLVLTNMTTLETMEAEDKLKQASIDPNSSEAKNSKIMKSKFDIGAKRNWEQVMGTDKLTWLLPFIFRSGFPQGDGVRWRVHYSRIVDEEDDA